MKILISNNGNTETIKAICMYPMGKDILLLRIRTLGEPDVDYSSFGYSGYDDAASNSYVSYEENGIVFIARPDFDWVVPETEIKIITETDEERELMRRAVRLEKIEKDQIYIQFQNPSAYR